MLQLLGVCTTLDGLENGDTQAQAIPESVLAAYGAIGARIDLLSGGRTNRTLRVRAGEDLVVQRLNPLPGLDLHGVMENLVRVSAHLEWKRTFDRARTNGSGPGTSSTDGASEASNTSEARNSSEARNRTWWPELALTESNRPFLVDEDGDLWRAFRYRPGRIARSRLPPESFASAAGLFGRFTCETADLDGPNLLATVPGFHDLETIWDRFVHDLDAAGQAPVGLDHQSDGESVRERMDWIAGIRDRIERRAVDDGLGTVAHRVVHNDTKLSNVLLAETSSDAIAVLDLDLMMMGPVWHDFGDLVRSAAWNAGDNPTMSIPLFKMLASSFARSAGPTLSDDEIATFAVAGPRLAFELGIRYLSAHLVPRGALHVDGGDGRLARGIANLSLAHEMLSAYDALRSVVDDLVAQR